MTIPVRPEKKRRSEQSHNFGLDWNMDNIREKTIGQLKSIYIEPLSAAMPPVRVEKQSIDQSITVTADCNSTRSEKRCGDCGLIPESVVRLN